MVAYRRNVISGAGYFFTVTLPNHTSRLLLERSDRLRDVMQSVWPERPFEIHARVVFPDLIHCYGRSCLGR
jgi:REP element-mobilizing transposase RayT